MYKVARENERMRDKEKEKANRAAEAIKTMF